jgi:hypothetical protein
MSPLSPSRKDAGVGLLTSMSVCLLLLLRKLRERTSTVLPRHQRMLTHAIVLPDGFGLSYCTGRGRGWRKKWGVDSTRIVARCPCCQRPPSPFTS